MKDCSQCGKSVEKYHRVFKGEGYCTTCYAREFKPKPCAKCGQIYRLPRSADNLICDKCRNNKPCIRCGKQNHTVGKITQYGVVCNSCAHYFREKRACGRCGNLTARLSRLDKTKIGIQLCTTCYTAAKEHQTCPKCRKYRLLVETDLGLMCKKCATLGKQPCQECGKYIYAGIGSKCRDCVWKDKLNKRVDLLVAGIKAKTALRYAFRLFAAWLATDIGNDKAAMNVERYAPFFQEAANFWDGLPDYPTVLQHFKPGKMRKFLKVKQWLESLESLESLKYTNVLSQDLAEQDRICNLLGKAANNPVAKYLLTAYHDKMMAKLESGKTTLKSVRLALQPAVGLMLNLNKLPSQQNVDEYLKEKPGQRAALVGFIHFLSYEYNLGLKIKKLTSDDKQKLQQKRKQELEKQVIDYVIKCRNNPDAFDLGEWAKLALYYFHDFKIASDYSIQKLENCYLIKISNNIFYIPIIKTYK